MRSDEDLTPAARAVSRMPRPLRSAGVHLLLAAGLAVCIADTVRQETRMWRVDHDDALRQLTAIREAADA